MLSINHNIVNDRNSNRLDNVMDILGADVVGNCLHQLRCLMHQQCFDRFALERGESLRGWGRGFKRYAIEPAMTLTATPTWQARLASSSSTGHRAVNYAG